MFAKFLTRHRVTVRLMLLAIVIFGVVGNSFAQSVALDIDTDQFITSINTWLALVVGIVVIGVGIRGAFALAGYVGEMIVAAFERRRM